MSARIIFKQNKYCLQESVLWIFWQTLLKVNTPEEAHILAKAYEQVSGRKPQLVNVPPKPEKIIRYKRAFNKYSAYSSGVVNIEEDKSLRGSSRMGSSTTI